MSEELLNRVERAIDWYDSLLLSDDGYDYLYQWYDYSFEWLRHISRLVVAIDYDAVNSPEYHPYS